MCFRIILIKTFIAPLITRLIKALLSFTYTLKIFIYIYMYIYILICIYVHTYIPTDMYKKRAQLVAKDNH